MNDGATARSFHRFMGSAAASRINKKRTAAKNRKSLKNLVPEGGVEPPRVLPRRILSPLRLPFRHSGFTKLEYSIT